MSDEDSGQIRSRRERLGMTKAELAREAKVSRHTLAAIENGEGYQRATLAKLERALRSLEEEAGLDAPPPRRGDEQVTVEVELPDGRVARVITRGDAPADKVAEQVAAILRRMSADPPQ